MSRTKDDFVVFEKKGSGSFISRAKSFVDSLEQSMANEKQILVIGLDPALIDFSQPRYAPGMNTAKVLAGLKSSEVERAGLGYSVQMCLTDFCQ